MIVIVSTPVLTMCDLKQAAVYRPKGSVMRKICSCFNRVAMSRPSHASCLDLKNRKSCMGVNGAKLKKFRFQSESPLKSN